MHYVGDSCSPPHTPQEIFNGIQDAHMDFLKKDPSSQFYQPTRTNKQPERDLQGAVIEWLVKHDVTYMELVVKPSVFWHDKRMVRKESPMRGWPDIICIVKGRFVGCELKVKSVQSDYQKMAQEKIEKGGGVYKICKSLADVEAVLKPFM